MKTGILVVKAVAVLLNCMLLVFMGHSLYARLTYRAGTLQGALEEVLLFSFYFALPIVNLIAILLLSLPSKNNK